MIDQVKQYLNIDFDYFEEDRFIQTLIIAGETYIKNATGKNFEEDNELHCLCLMILVSHWYENREAVGKAEKLAFSLSSLLTQIEYGR